MSLLQALFGAKPAFGTPPFAPPHPQTGGADTPPAPGQQQHGISGFLERALNPTNGLGQLGQMLLASQDNGIGRIAQMQIQQRMAQQNEKPKGPHFEHIGDQFGVIDDNTGAFTPTYSAPHQATGYGAELDAAGIVGDERARLLRQHAINAADPIMTIDDGNGTRFLPRSQVSGAIPGALGVSSPAPSFTPGMIRNGYQLIGGDPTDKNNWKPVGGAGSQGPATFPARAVDAVIGQESGGRAGAVGPQTAWGRAQGLMQVLPSTAKGVAAKLGVPFRPDLMTGTSPAATQYQQAIGTAYLQEGYDKTGNLRDALRYYHGGPNRSMWRAKTNRYADEVLARIGGRG